MRFSLLHPSRKRIEMAEGAVREWLANRSGEHEVEYILSVDSDDDVEGYRRMADRMGVRLVANPNRSMVAASNSAAAESSGDLLIVVSDDFGCPPDWDLELARVVGDRRDVAVLVHDGGPARITTLPIVGRELYRQWGFVLHPGYRSMFSDDDLTEHARLIGRLVDARHLVFQHRHVSAGLSPLDETYQHENSDDAWWTGRRLLQRRRVMRFGHRPPSLRMSVELGILDAAHWIRVAGSWVKERLRRRGILARRPKFPLPGQDL